jgi:Tfp pilus assembly pilus retraction ATPase PilT
MALIRMFEELVKLAGHLAWPVAILIVILVIKKELKAVFSSVTKRISDPASDISITKQGLEIKNRVDAALGRIESLEVDQNQSKELIFGVLGERKEQGVRSEAETGSTIEPELVALANEYLNISASDWAERVRLKDEVARKMANMVIIRRISKDSLVTQDHEGLLMALVSTIHTTQDERDFARISKMAHKVRKLHIKYRTVMALGRIFEQNLATKADADRALEILDLYEVGADAPLSRRITQTKAIIKFAINRLPRSAEPSALSK